MAKIKYCCDCDHYIPGGRERNCTAHPYSKDSVSALKEACSKFIPRGERTEETFAPITYKLRRTRRKSYEITK